MRLSLLFIFFAFVLTCPVYAGNPAPLFEKPVKVDDSGRPLYNSWERNEYERNEQIKKKQNLDGGVNHLPDSPNSKSLNVPIPTPSSTIINRPLSPQESIQLGR